MYVFAILNKGTNVQLKYTDVYARPDKYEGFIKLKQKKIDNLLF